MAKRYNSKAGAKPKPRREKVSVTDATPRERASAPTLRPSRGNGAFPGPRSASLKSASTERHPVPLRVAESKAHSAPPGATISRRAADRLRAGHLWVYASDILAIVAPKPEKDLLPVADQRGLLMGTAL